MRDNRDTAPDVMESRFRASRGQSTLNVELGLLDKESFSSESGASGSSNVSTQLATNVTSDLSGGTSPGGVGCFIGSTLFSLFNQPEITFAVLYKHREFYIGKFAVSYDSGVRVAGKIEDVFEVIGNEWLKVTFSDDSVDEVKPEHKYETEQGYAPICELKDKFVWSENELLQVVSIETVKSKQGVKFYNARISYRNYVANGKRVSNQKEPIEPT